MASSQHYANSQNGKTVSYGHKLRQLSDPSCSANQLPTASCCGVFQNIPTYTLYNLANFLGTSIAQSSTMNQSTDYAEGSCLAFGVPLNQLNQIGVSQDRLIGMMTAQFLNGLWDMLIKNYDPTQTLAMNQKNFENVLRMDIQITLQGTDISFPEGPVEDILTAYPELSKLAN